MDYEAPHKNTGLRDALIVITILAVASWFLYHKFHDIRYESRLKAITGHLRYFSSAAQTYMMEKGVKRVAYTDLFGTGKDKYLGRPLVQVLDEDYSHLVIVEGQSQISITSATMGNIVYSL